jgi:hypothetical protein
MIGGERVSNIAQFFRVMIAPTQQFVIVHPQRMLDAIAN